MNIKKWWHEFLYGKFDNINPSFQKKAMNIINTDGDIIGVVEIDEVGMEQQKKEFQQKFPIGREVIYLGNKFTIIENGGMSLYPVGVFQFVDYFEEYLLLQNSDLEKIKVEKMELISYS